MTGLAPRAMGGDGPGVAAEGAAEAIRTVNHLTLVAPSPGVPQWEDVADLYQVLGDLRLLVERLPQLLSQLARHLERPACGGYRRDGGTTDTPDGVVACAVAALGAARDSVSNGAAELGVARTAISRLAPRSEAR